MMWGKEGKGGRGKIRRDGGRVGERVKWVGLGRGGGEQQTSSEHPKMLDYHLRKGFNITQG